jgi:hypothetical protein
MGEMAYEPPPLTEVPYVPLVPDWAPNAFHAWHKAFYGGRRLIFVWGWLIPVWLVAVACKAAIYWAGVILLMVGWGLSSVYGIATYRHRQKRAVERALEEFHYQLGDLDAA